MSKRIPNLVLGTVMGYGFEDLKPFVRSLWKSGFDGELVLLWTKLSHETREALEAEGVRMVEIPYRGAGALNSWSRFWPWLRLWLNLPVGNRIRKAIYRRILNLEFVRYLHALDFLQREDHRYQNVLLTDVRDVLFQCDPFADPLPAPLLAFQEDRKMCYGQSPLNDSWVLGNYGEITFERLRNQRITCCGTVVGTQSGMIRYLEAFVGEIRGLRTLDHGADTSVHNVLCRLSSSLGVEVQENLHGLVATVGANDPEHLPRNHRGLLTRPDGSLIPVIHQLDRFPTLEHDVLKALGIL
jgi:hypothetical protein